LAPLYLSLVLSAFGHRSHGSASPLFCSFREPSDLSGFNPGITPWQFSLDSVSDD
jgi:hypothetical protein